jgi:hypothetical protein
MPCYGLTSTDRCIFVTQPDLDENENSLFLAIMSISPWLNLQLRAITEYPCFFMNLQATTSPHSLIFFGLPHNLAQHLRNTSIKLADRHNFHNQLKIKKRKFYFATLLNFVPTRNLIDFEASIQIFSFVFGSTPRREARVDTEKVPNPII